MTAYYNEFDPFAAAWLRELISAGHIAPGDVDTRSIVDVRPDDLRGYTQCHFFAGIGVWSYALRRAGWSDDRPIWTGSCPCQPFSAAGKGGGFDDERHLWPHFHYLIEECGPPVVAGEQVASKDGLAWLDLVQADMEGTGYAFGAVDTCAAGFGSPNVRQRLWWLAERLADAARIGSGTGLCDFGSAGQRRALIGNNGRASWLEHACDDGPQGWVSRREDPERGIVDGSLGRDSAIGGLGHSGKSGFPEQRSIGGIPSTAGGTPAREAFERTGASISGLADNSGERWLWRQGLSTWGVDDGENAGRVEGDNGPFSFGEIGDGPQWPGPTNGFWRDADWLFCRDGKWRPVEPGTFPLAHGAPARMGRLRGYGNAINAEQAQGFIEAYLETKAVDVQHFRLTELSEKTTDNDIQEDIFS